MVRCKDGKLIKAAPFDSYLFKVFKQGHDEKAAKGFLLHNTG